MEFKLSLNQFLKDRKKFALGDLVTEQSHPLTKELSFLAKNRLSQAYETLVSVDHRALALYLDYGDEVAGLSVAVRETLAAGSRVFLVGCGATGRLSLNLEFLWREANPQNDQIFSLMAGGDTALIHALEGFEDHPDFGQRHLIEMGFQEGDLLIATTEGGETPYVIGATKAATKISSRSPYFLYCNPKEILLEKVERSRRILENPRVKEVCLFVGPMALAGSTRMQASTVLMMALAQALFSTPDHFESEILEFQAAIKELPLDQLSRLTELESQVYQEGHHTIYQSQAFGLTVLTDTTERSPTFHLQAFDNERRPKELPSLTYLCVSPELKNQEAWIALLGRTPRPLNWLDVHEKTDLDYLMGFPLGESTNQFRRALVPTKEHFVFKISQLPSKICLNFKEVSLELKAFSTSWKNHIFLKMILNMHSTLVMGRLGRFEGNLMTYVVPTNGKLIDRSIRYIRELLPPAVGKNIGDEKIAEFLFDEIENPSQPESQPIVLRVRDRLKP